MRTCAVKLATSMNASVQVAAAPIFDKSGERIETLTIVPIAIY